MTLIFGGSTDVLSAHHTSQFIAPLLRWINPAVSEQTIRAVQIVVRKSGHLSEYAVLSFLLWRAFRQPSKNDPRPWSWKVAALAIFVSALYAMSDEFHQSFVATRQASIWDVLIDTTGATLAMIILWKFRMAFKLSKK